MDIKYCDKCEARISGKPWMSLTLAKYDKEGNLLEDYTIDLCQKDGKAVENELFES